MTNKNELKANLNCDCGRRFPWHLWSVGDERLSHHCGCGAVWKWKSEKLAVRS